MCSVDVSILICTYNHEKYIEQAIKSVLCQDTEYTYELIVGDDASTDYTAEIIKKYALNNRYIIPVLHKENVGATRNVYDMVRMAKGRYITSIDGDDCFFGTNRIQWQVDFLERHPEYSAVCGKCILIDDGNQRIESSDIEKKKRFWEFDKEVFSWSDFEQWKMPGHISTMMARNCWEEVDAKLFYKVHDVVGDRTGVFASLFGGPIFCKDEIVSCYRICGDRNHFMEEYVQKNLRAKEVHMMQCFEEYAYSKGRVLNLATIKKHRLIGAVCIWMKNPTDENMEVICKIINEIGNSPEYMTLVIKTLILKSYYWHTLHEDRPIEVD